jgi:hypothetical protein
MEGIVTLVLFAALVLLAGPPSATGGEALARDSTAAKKTS